MRHRAQLEQQLARVPLFAALSENQMHDLSGVAVRAREAAGTPLMRQGERGNELLVLLEGTVEVRRAGVVLATLGPGSHLGEIALVDDRAVRTADVVATTPVTVAYLGRREFGELLDESSELRVAVLQAVAARLADLEPLSD